MDDGIKFFFEEMSIIFVSFDITYFSRYFHMKIYDKKTKRFSNILNKSYYYIIRFEIWILKYFLIFNIR